MQLSDIQYLLEFTVWADGKVLDGARHISAERLRVSHPMPHDSIFDTLVHMMNAQQFWLNSCGGISPRLPEGIHDLDQLGAAWDAVHGNLQAFVDGLNVDQLQTTITYDDIHGVARAHRLQWLIIHLFNHSTEHRSQVAAMIATAGYDVGWLDMVFFMWNSVAPQ